jgi:hypothetical protein
MDLKGAFLLMAVRADKAKRFGVDLLSAEENEKTVTR